MRPAMLAHALLRLLPRRAPPPPPPSGSAEPLEPLVLVLPLSHALLALCALLVLRAARLLWRMRAVQVAYAARLAPLPPAPPPLLLAADKRGAGPPSCAGSDSSPSPASGDADGCDEPRRGLGAEGVAEAGRQLTSALAPADLSLGASLQRLRHKPPPMHDAPDVDELLAEHGARVRAMLARACAEGWAGFKPGQHDALYALRFLLSHKLCAEKAACAMKETLAWRERNRVDEINAFVRTHPQSAFPGHARIAPHFYTPVYTPAGDWPPFMVIDAAILDPAALMGEISVDDYVVYSMYLSELMHARCDEITRRTRKLMKATRLVGMAGLRVRHASMGFARAAAAAAKDHVDCYPQNLGHLFLCNVPYAMRVLWDGAVRPLLPERVIEKTSVLNPLCEPADLDRVTDYVRFDELPACIHPGAGGAR